MLITHIVHLITGEGQFKAMEGIAVSTDGHIIVCDRENHRVQVF